MTSCNKPAEPAAAPKPAGPSIKPEKMADALFCNERYSCRLYQTRCQTLGKKKLIKPHEKWEDRENGIMLPAQMFLIVVT